MSEDLDVPIGSTGKTTPSESTESLLQNIRSLMTSTEYSAVRRQVESGDLSHWLAGFFYFLKFIDEDDCFLECTIKGMKAFLTQAARWEAHEPETAKNREVEIMIAKREKTNDFSGIHNRHTVTLWNMLDATLFESLVHLFLSNSKVREISSFQKIKLSLKEYD